MKYTVIACSIFAGCLQQQTQHPVTPSSHPAASAIPTNVQAAVSVLLQDRPYTNQAEVRQAGLVLQSFEEPIPGIVETFVDNDGNDSTAVTHTFQKAGIVIDYHDDKITGARRIERQPETSNKSQEESLRAFSVKPPGKASRLRR